MRQINPVKLRDALTYTKQKIVADRLKVSSTTVSRWVRGERPVPHKYLVDLCKAVGKRSTELCYTKAEMEAMNG